MGETSLKLLVESGGRISEEIDRLRAFRATMEDDWRIREAEKRLSEALHWVAQALAAPAPR